MTTISPLKKSIFTLLFLFIFIGVDAQSTPLDTLFFKDRIQPLGEENIFKTEGYYNWGGSIIKGPEGKYHLFYARWKKDYSFYGWLTHSEVAHATSDHPAGPWTYVETVLQGRGYPHWDAITVHNPKIKYYDGKYYLYYISTNMGGQKHTEEDLVEIAYAGNSNPRRKILRSNQRPGVAVSHSLSGPWERKDTTLLEPGGPIITLAVNPAITQGKDKRYYLVVKGDKPNVDGFVRNQAIAIGDHPDGPFEIQPRPVIDYLDTEDMSIWYDTKREYYYGVFHAHTFIGMVSSADGIHWKKATEYSLTPKGLKMKNGDTLRPDRLERPFIYVENNEPRVLSLSVKKGDNSYTIFVPIKEKERPLPNPRQLAWQEAELGAIFHYDLHVFDDKKYNQAINRIKPVEDYQIFNPQKLDTDQWVKSIKDAGFTFALITATHETGFALFQSDVNPYGMKALNFQNGKGDIVRDFVNSCRKYGIKPGIYLGIRWNSFFGVHDFKVNGEGVFRDNRQKYYNKMVEGMLKELCTRYGPLFEIWFDGGADHPDNGAPDVLPIVQQYQPNCLFYHNKQLAEARWGGSESGMMAYPNFATFPTYNGHGSDSFPEQVRLLKMGDPDGQYWIPAMADAPLRGYNGRHEWFWEPGDEDHIFPLSHLMEMYEKSVGRNATLIVGLTPDDQGLLPDPDVQRLKEWGDAIEREFGDPLAEVAGTGKEVEMRWERPTTVNRIIIQEDIKQGERVRAYEVEALVEDNWIKITEGISIGHKRIQRFDPIQCTGIRLLIKESEGSAIIKQFAVFERLED